MKQQHDIKPALSESVPHDSDGCEFDDSFESVAELTESEDDDVTIIGNTTATAAPPSKDTVYYRCDKCSYQTRIQHLLNLHVAKHASGRPEMLDCSMCEFSSHYVSSMKHHIKVFHSNIYRCNLCDKIMTKHILIKHRESFHGGEAQNLEACDDEKMAADESRFGIPDCKDDIPDDDAPDMVIKEPPISPKSECDYDQTTSKPDDSNHGVDEVEPNLKCSICAFTTQNRFSLKYHVVVFHKKKVQCECCPLVMTRHDLIQHVAEEHAVTTGPKDLASVDQATSSNLESEGSDSSSVTDEPDPPSNQDVPDLSSASKELKCSYCEYSTPISLHLDDHVHRLHSKKYYCNHCSSVMTKYELLVHSKNVHGVTLKATGRSSHFREATQGLKDHTAPVGNKGSEFSGVAGPEPSSAEDVADDGGTLTILKCSFCQYRSPRRIQLSEHEFRLHTKKYHCNQCPVIMTKFELIEHCSTAHGKTIKAIGRCILKAAKVNLKAPQPDPSHPKPECSNNNVNLTTNQDAPAQVVATKCQFCDYSPLKMSNIKGHIVRMHKVRYSCALCKKIMTKHNIIKHSKEVHGVAKFRRTFRKDCSEKAVLTRGPNHRKSPMHTPKESTRKPLVSKRKPVSQLTLRRPSSYHSLSKPYQETAQSNPEQETSIESGPSTTDKKFSNTFACQICAFSSRSRTNLSNHITHIHTKKYTCNYCPVVMTKYGLIKHCEAKHGVEMKVRGRKSSSEVRADKLGKYGNPSHSEDGSSQTHAPSIEDKDAGEPGPSTAKVTTISTDVSEEKDERMHNCQICEFTSPLKRNLTNHKATFHYRRFKCNYCSTEMTKYNLIRHTMQKHGVDMKFQEKKVCNDSEMVPGSQVALQDSQVASSGSSHQIHGLSSGDHSSKGNEPAQKSTKKKSTKKLCSVCHISLHPRSFDRHFLLYHTVKYECSHCPAVMTRYELYKHSKKVHGIIISQLAGRVRRTIPKVKTAEKTADYASTGEAPKSSRDSNSSEESSEIKGYISKNSGDNPSKNLPPKVENMAEDHLEGRRSGEVLHCLSCQFSSNYQKVLQRHKISFHSQKHRCEHCLAVFTKYELMQHSSEVHGITMSWDYWGRKRNRGETLHSATRAKSMGLLNVKAAEITAGSSSKGEIVSESPSEEVANPALEEVRKPSYGAIEEPSCEEVTKDDKSKMAVETENQVLLQCKDCSWQTGREDLLLRHEVKHAPLECPICGSKFKKGYSFVNHLAKHNCSKSRYKCFYCGIIKKGVSGLWQHLSNHIEALKKHDCPKCEFSYLRPSVLQEHIKIHQGSMNDYPYGELIKSTGESNRLKDRSKNNEYLSTHSVADVSHTEAPDTHESSTSEPNVSPLKMWLNALESSSAKVLKCNTLPSSELSEITYIRSTLVENVVNSSRHSGANIADSRTEVPTTSKPSTVEPAVYPSEIWMRTLESSSGKLCALNPSPASEVVSEEARRPPAIIDRTFELTKAEPNREPEGTTSLSTQAGTSSETKTPSGSLQCYDCSYSTRIRSLLCRHMKLHLPEGQFVCSNCDFRASKNILFAKHLASHGVPGAPIRCCFCIFISDNIHNMAQHANTHRPVGTYFCSKCEYSCSVQYALDQHLLNHHSKKFSCPVCPKVGTRFKISGHIKKRHHRNATGSELKALLPFGPLLKPIKKLAKKGGFPSNIQRKLAAKQAFRKRISSQQELKCKSCDYCTLREDLLHRHEAKHVPLECPVCDMQFDKGYSFTVHLSQHNPQELPFKCFYCGEILTHLGELYRHHSLHLTSMKIHDCPRCEFSSLRRDYLELHMSTHSNKHKPMKANVPPLKIQIGGPDQGRIPGDSNSPRPSAIVGADAVAGPSKIPQHVLQSTSQQQHLTEPSKSVEGNEKALPEVKHADVTGQLSGREPQLPRVDSATKSPRFLSNWAMILNQYLTGSIPKKP